MKILDEKKNIEFYDTLEGVYTEKGYFNIENMIDDKFPFLFVVGGRGTGKTYSTLKYCMDKRHAFIRRTVEEIKALTETDNADMSMSESPWRQLNEDMDGSGHCIKAFKIGSGRYMFCDIGNKFNWNADKEELEKIRKPLANIIALSQAGKIKGAGYENVEYIIIDEFIPMQGTRDIRLDGYHTQHIYETISRNRVDNGLSPTKLICLANATTIGNSTFLEFGLINDVYYMVKNGYCRADFIDRGIRVLLLPADSDFTKRKAESPLYKAIPKTSRMYQSSIENKFVADDFKDVIEKCDLRRATHYAYITNTTGKIYTLYCLPDNAWRLEEGIKGKGKRDVFVFDLNRVSDVYNAKATIYADTWCDYCEGRMSFDSYESKVLYFMVVDKKITPLS